MSSPSCPLWWAGRVQQSGETGKEDRGRREGEGHGGREGEEQMGRRERKEGEGEGREEGRREKGGGKGAQIIIIGKHVRSQFHSQATLGATPTWPGNEASTLTAYEHVRAQYSVQGKFLTSSSSCTSMVSCRDTSSITFPCASLNSCTTSGWLIPVTLTPFTCTHHHSTTS